MSRIQLGPEVPVLVSDLVPYRLGLAEKLGGLVVDLNERTVTEGVQDHGLEALDLAIDTSGKGVARRAYLDALDRRGVLVCAGHGEELHLEVSRDLIAPERAVLGSEYFGYGELASNLELFREHLPFLRRIITHRFPVSDVRSAFELFFGGETGKVVVEQ